jgi:hypothetical protein
MIKLTVFNPDLENTPQDLKKTIENLEIALKDEICMVSGWRLLGYATAQEFMQDDYYSIVKNIAWHLS